MLNALEKHPAEEQVPAYQVYIVDVFPRQAPLPQNSLAVAQRMADMLFADKTDYDQKSAQWVNEYINLVEILRSLDNDLLTRIKVEIKNRVENNDLLRSSCPDMEEHYQEILDHKRAILHVTNIKRKRMPDEPDLSELDFSLEMVDALIRQGHDDATRALKQQGRENGS